MTASTADMILTMSKLNVIPTNKHVLVCGGTGSGKSYLAEHYLRGYKYVVKLDTKDEVSERRLQGVSAWDGLTVNKDFCIISNFDELDDAEFDKIIYRPDYYDQTVELFDKFFDWIFRRENTIVWIDELMQIANAHSAPRSLSRCYTQGRSKNIGIWGCSQRPAGIPAICLANSDYYFIFNMFNINDRKRLYEMTGMEQMLELPRDHNFWYYQQGQDKCIKAVLKE